MRVFQQNQFLYSAKPRTLSSEAKSGREQEVPNVPGQLLPNPSGVDVRESTVVGLETSPEEQIERPP
jgi:hypothetical protein